MVVCILYAMKSCAVANKLSIIGANFQNYSVSVARRGEFSRFMGFLAQKGGQIFEDGDLWD